MSTCVYEFLNLSSTNFTRAPVTSASDNILAADAGHTNFSVDLTDTCTSVAYLLEFIVPIIIYIVLVVLVVQEQRQLVILQQGRPKRSSKASEAEIELTDVASSNNPTGSQQQSRSEYFASALPAHLEEEEASLNSLLSLKGVHEAPPAAGELSFHNVNVSVKLAGGRTKKIVNNVTAAAVSGQLFAVLGPSGGGKTTLIDVLAGNIATQCGCCNKLSVEGTVSLHGRELSQRQRRTAFAYIHQDDILLNSATVREYMVFNAEILLTPLGLSRQEREIRVDSLLDAFKLRHIRHSLIGDHSHRGISGGEMRRLSVAIGLLAKPGAVCLDEPTTGLDSHNAMQLMQLVQNWANTIGAAHVNSQLVPPPVLLSVHQPSSRLFSHFHRVMILCAGRVVFVGRPDEVTPFFVSNSLQKSLTESSDSDTQQGNGIPTASSAQTSDVVDPTLDDDEDPTTKCIESKLSESHQTSDGAGGKHNEHDDSANKFSTDQAINPAEFALNCCSGAERNDCLDQLVQANVARMQTKVQSPDKPQTSTGRKDTNTAGKTLLDMQIELFGAEHHVRKSQTVSQAGSDDQVDASETDSLEWQPRRGNCCLEFKLLLSRDFRHVLRHPSMSLGYVGFTSLLAVLIGAVYFNAPDTLAGVINRAGLFFFSSLYFLLTGQVSLVQFHSARRLFLRERAAKLYSASAYFWSKVVVDVLLLRVVPSCFFAGMVHLLVQLRADEECRSLWFFLLLQLQTLASSMTFLLIGAACATLAIAEFVGALAILLCLLFSGFLLTQPSLEEKGADWLLWLTYSNSIYQVMILNEFSDSSFYIESSGGGDSSIAAAEVNSSTIFTELGIDSSPDAADIFVGFSAAYVVALALLGWLALGTQSYLKK